jgi:transcriptional regulator with XRE-family HTH domain
MDNQQIRERIARRLEETGKSMRAASLNAGMSADAIRDIFRKQDSSPTIETLRKLAVGLDTTPEWLIFGTDDLARGASSKLEPGSTVEELAARGSFGFAKVDGAVQAGAFLAVEAFDDDLGEVISAPRDPIFPFARQRAYRVKGDSMNEAEPKPIKDGDYIITAVWEDLGLEPKNGLNVVVQQTTADSQLRERSVKELKVFPDRVEFHPRSSNRAHKPIIVNREYHTDDGKEVRILDLVRFVFDNQALPV